MDPNTARTEGTESLKVDIVSSLEFENCADRKAKDPTSDL